MKISIITIAFNNENDIRGTIESVIGQTYNCIEYIIIDGKSEDTTLEIIQEYEDKIELIISEQDRGIYDAINKGIQKSTGDVVGLIHAGDQLFNKFTIEKIVNHFNNYDIDASYGHSVFINKKNRVVRVNKSPEFNKKLFEYGWMPSHQSIYIKREIFNNLGLYRLDLGGSGDYEFVLRYFYCNDLKTKLLDEFIIKFALGGTSTSNYHKLLKTQQTHVECWRLNGIEPPFYLIPLKLFRKVPQFVKALFK